MLQRQALGADRLPDSQPALILASASPRRRALLAQLGLDCQCVSAEIDESPRLDESACDCVRRLALAKAQQVRARIDRNQVSTAASPRLILAADTAVTVDGEPLGKPADAAEAARMLALLSARWHQVITGVALLGRQCHNFSVTTRVLFRRIEPAEAQVYWASGEPRDKAGGYGIQGLGALFVARIEGSYSNIVGLPLFETGQLLAREGLSPWPVGATLPGGPEAPAASLPESDH